jgi:hypothetical protein
MKGNNTLIVNASTMVEAMQEYLDRRTAGAKADKVEHVTYANEGVNTVYKFGLSERKGDTK